MDFPEDLRYTSEHEWARLSGDGLVTMGITDYAQDALGDIVYVALPEVGLIADPGGTVGEVESTKSVSEIYAPCGGEVVAVNSALDDTPEKINADPYGDGWIARIRPIDPAELDGLMDADAYRALVEA
jgi:glycine cleavage system H protein